MRHQILNRCPIWREDQNVVARIDSRLKRAKESLHAAVDDDHVFGISFDLVSLTQLVRNCAPQFSDAGRWRIPGLILRQSSNHGLFDVIGRCPVRFAALEAVDLGALRQQFHNPIAD